MHCGSAEVVSADYWESKDGADQADIGRCVAGWKAKKWGNFDKAEAYLDP